MKRLFHNIRLATMVDKAKCYGFIESAAVRVESGHIIWVGPQADIKPVWLRQDHCIDGGGKLLTPGLIDCHTHLVYSGDRADEFEQRLNGTSYEDIAKAGGGINATVNATRAADHAELLAQSLPRVDALLSEGVTTLEIKSGYGLSTDDELKMLRVAEAIGERRPVNVTKTLLGAHALPREFFGRSDAYIQMLCEQMLPTVARQQLADAVDGFCENIAFSRNQIRRVFLAARKLNLPVKLHAEQLSLQGGASLAAEFGALSADHLEYLDQAGIDAMAAAGTTAVLLPGAFYFLQETQKPPVQALRAAGVPIAIASDCNPGSSPIHSLLLIMNMACTLFALTPEEALAGVTRNAAKALGMDTNIGTVEVGKRADFALWDLEHPAQLSYHLGFNRCIGRYLAGCEVATSFGD